MKKFIIVTAVLIFKVSVSISGAVFASNEYEKEFHAKESVVKRLWEGYEERVKKELTPIMLRETIGKNDRNEIMAIVQRVKNSPEAQAIAKRISEDFVKDVLLPTINKFAWAIPNADAIAEICKYEPIIEIGAGSGYWAKLIAEQGAEIVAFDDNSWREHGNHSIKNIWFEGVALGDETVISDYPKHTLFICFPPRDEGAFAVKALRLYRGKFLIYVGEDRGGVTGDDEFFDELDQNFSLESDSIALQNWPGYTAKLKVYKRKGI